MRYLKVNKWTTEAIEIAEEVLTVFIIKAYGRTLQLQISDLECVLKEISLCH